MTVDDKQGLLWVATTSALWDGPAKEAEIAAFELRSGRQVRAVRSPQALSFNDVAIAPNGDLYATDSIGGTVFRAACGGTTLERLVESASFGYPNGLTVSGDGRWLYIAQGISLRRIDLQTREISRVSKSPNLSLAGIDGLYWSNGDLIAVQNGAADRVLRLRLNSAGDTIVSHVLLDGRDARLDTPTTAAIGRGRIYLLANAQVSKLKPDGSVDAALKTPDPNSRASRRVKE